ncbi:hypothetical protein SUGI_0252220 [Cryptomeria japonica]|nr:hypothetical protein SUGI_0252220 [Cryptomeria japonica]
MLVLKFQNIIFEKDSKCNGIDLNCRHLLVDDERERWSPRMERRLTRPVETRRASTAANTKCECYGGAAKNMNSEREGLAQRT